MGIEQLRKNNDETESSMFDSKMAQLFNSDTKDENFHGFVGEFC